MGTFINTVDIIGDDALVDLIITRDITELYDSYVTTMMGHCFAYCTLLTVVDVPNCSILGQYALHSSGVKTLVLRSGAIASLSVINTLKNTPITKGTGYIYVPAALIDTYKAATNWSTYADQFRALEDYTVDGTTTGDLDETKI